MADTTVPEAAMEVETNEVDLKPVENCANGGSKRSREVDDEVAGENGEKKAKVEPEAKESGEISVGPKKFQTSVEMFDYFFKILHSWSPNIDLNKYEHIVTLELIKKGHQEADKKIGSGIKAFQVRFHPQFKSRCFFILREDESADDFSFRKCIDHISPLPENMQVNHEVNKALRGKGSGGFRGRGGRGRGGGGRR